MHFSFVYVQSTVLSYLLLSLHELKDNYTYNPLKHLQVTTLSTQINKKNPVTFFCVIENKHRIKKQTPSLACQLFRPHSRLLMPPLFQCLLIIILCLLYASYASSSHLLRMPPYLEVKVLKVFRWVRDFWHYESEGVGVMASARCIPLPP